MITNVVNEARLGTDVGCRQVQCINVYSLYMYLFTAVIEYSILFMNLSDVVQQKQEEKKLKEEMNKEKDRERKRKIVWDKVS